MASNSKTDEFSEKFQTAFDPPPSFSENHIAIFSEIHDRSIVYSGKNLQYKFLDWKWPPPPPFGTFPKIHPFWRRSASLRGLGGRRFFVLKLLLLLCLYWSKHAVCCWETDSTWMSSPMTWAVRDSWEECKELLFPNLTSSIFYIFSRSPCLCDVQRSQRLFWLKKSRSTQR